MFGVHYVGMRINKLVKLVHVTFWTVVWCYLNICKSKKVLLHVYLYR